MEEPVLGHGVTEGEEQVFVVLRLDVGDAPAVAQDARLRADVGRQLAVVAGNPAPGLFTPPVVELWTRDAAGAAERGDRLARAQTFQSFASTLFDVIH